MCLVPGCALANETWSVGCQSVTTTTCSNLSAVSLIGMMIFWASGMAMLPLTKSTCTSMTIKTSLDVICIWELLVLKTMRKLPYRQRVSPEIHLWHEDCMYSNEFECC